MKKFSQLTPEELESLTNGCGIGKFIHNSIFETACRKHDFHYYIWKTADKKILADIIFLKDMLLEIAKVAGWTLLATIYFLLVMTFGWLVFYKRNHS
jgi:uncharacterized membrane protein